MPCFDFPITTNSDKKVFAAVHGFLGLGVTLLALLGMVLICATARYQWVMTKTIAADHASTTCPATARNAAKKMGFRLSAAEVTDICKVEVGAATKAQAELVQVTK